MSKFSIHTKDSGSPEAAQLLSDAAYSAVVDKRGWVTQADIETFIDAGFTKAQVLEVILGVAYKTLSNYTNRLVDMPVDEVFAAREWRPAA